MVAQRIRKFFQNDWIIALFLLGVFLATNGYTYAWDDQHLEIPLLKSLIDPGLYPGDYYVQGLKNNFPSLMFPLLARVISVAQIPAAYLVLFLLSRYFLFFWIYKLWKLLSGHRTAGIYCVLNIILVGRVEEFLYRTFSHQEFALFIIAAGLYYFYKERFILSAALFGLAANFHALYSGFPFLYMAGYLLWRSREDGIKKLFAVLLAFTITALPVIFTIIQKYRNGGGGGDDQGWIGLYKIACPQNFIFYTHTFREMTSSLRSFFEITLDYWKLAALFAVNALFNPLFQRDKKTKALLAVATGLLVFSAIFSHIFPIKFVLDLNLVRNTQYMLFILGGYTILLLLSRFEEGRLRTAVLLALAFPLFRFGSYIQTLAILYLGTLLAAEENARWPRSWRIPALVLAYGLVIVLAGAIVLHLKSATWYSKTVLLVLGINMVLLILNSLPSHFLRNREKAVFIFRNLFLAITFICVFINLLIYHHTRIQVERYGPGFWQLQRNWIDMQNYVKAHTPKRALLLVPHDTEMGGFRILSERPIVVCDRDCGVIGFSYPAAVEWKKRMHDVEAFKVLVKDSIAPALLSAVRDYHVNYVVFMKYMKPVPSTLLEPVYENQVFALYKVLVNPI